MRNLDKEFQVYEKLIKLGEGLLPLSPLSELARCYEDVVESTEEGKEDE